MKLPFIIDPASVLEPRKDCPSTDSSPTREYKVTLCRKIIATCSVDAESYDEAARKAWFYSIVGSFWKGKPGEVIVESVEVVERKDREG
jgi:hypothetical protein